MQKNKFAILFTSLLYGLFAFFIVLFLQGIAFRTGLIESGVLSQKNIFGLFLPAFIEELLKIGLALFAFWQLGKPQNLSLFLGIPVGFGLVEGYFSPEPDFFSKPFLHTIFFLGGYFLSKNLKIKKTYQIILWILTSSLVHFFYNFYQLKIQ